MKIARLGKKNLLSTGLCLMTILPGLFIYNRLPEKIPVHFDIHGDPDGYLNKLFFIIGMPVFYAVIQLITCLLVEMDGKNLKNPKAKSLVRTILPLIFITVHSCILLYALGRLDNIMSVMLTVYSLIVLVIGNYMPKFKPNGTIGLRTPHTLKNEEVWRLSHRFAGRVWVICGVLLLPFGFLEKIIPYIIIFSCSIIIPIVYSEVIYKKLKDAADGSENNSGKGE